MATDFRLLTEASTAYYARRSMRSARIDLASMDHEGLGALLQQKQAQRSTG